MHQHIVNVFIASVVSLCLYQCTKEKVADHRHVANLLNK